ncbi:MAG TPA: DUF268 domain-containing protein [Methanocorpusculum sp.]|nr:DUF268 domain-containing protein [Methanocorpusculum sp.]HJK39299.1 DUF268 domain-containing protein [Methanocorpusculum sp.]HJK43213.1 DUF268 domain-containing protein [Methanocorpusculum sp.]
MWDVYNYIKRVLLKTNETLVGLILFFKNKKEYANINTRQTFQPLTRNYYPCLHDWSKNAGSLHTYFWQDLWASQKIYQNNPDKHYDIGSRIDGFIAHLLTFREVTMIDIRPLSLSLPNLNFIQANATSLENIKDNSVESLSSLCALEHFGLGRYGDPIDPDGCFKAFSAIERVMKPGGIVYISVPIGKERLMYNAHRIFYPSTVVNSFPQMKLIEFSVVNPSAEGIEKNVELHKYDLCDDDKGDRFGLFVFEKITE